MTAEELLSRLRGVRASGQRRWLALCPAHDERKRSLSVREGGDGRILLHCFAGCTSEQIIAALGLTAADLRPRSRRIKHGPCTRYEVRDTEGKLHGIHERRDRSDGTKSIVWWQPDGTAGLGGRPITGLPLYGSERLAGATPGSRVVVVEGEKAADALRDRGVPAVGTVTGAGSTPGPDALRPLLPFTVVLWGDADEPGERHMEHVAARLRSLGHANVSLVRWPEAPHKGDAADFEGSDGELEALLLTAAPFESPRASISALLDRTKEFLCKYVAVSAAQATVLALWTVHSHAFEGAESTPYLHIHSPEKRSGKSRLLEALSLVVARPWLTGRVSAAALVRKVDKDAPTLLLDESDSAFAADKEYSETLRGVLNSGWRRGGNATVCTKRAGDWLTQDFSTFSPKAIAGIGKLPDTVADRAIPIEMRRRTSCEPVARFRWREAQGETSPICEALAQWAAEATNSLRDARPDIPTELDDRAADIWEPLLAIADTAGHEWAVLARQAALALSAKRGEDDKSMGVLLLGDIRAVLDAKVAARLPSAALAEALRSIEESPWSDWRGRGLDSRQLARRLRLFGVRPHQIRLGDKTLKGYEASDFDDAWQRYLPPHTPPETETRETRETLTPVEPGGTGSAAGDVSDVSDVSPTQEYTDVPSEVAQVVIGDDVLPECWICHAAVFIFDNWGRPLCEAHAPENR